MARPAPLVTQSIWRFSHTLGAWAAFGDGRHAGQLPLYSLLQPEQPPQHAPPHQ